MRLDEEWRTILSKAWSVRFMVAAIILSAVDIFLPFIVPITTLPLAGLSLACTLLALWSRIVAQKGVP